MLCRIRDVGLDAVGRQTCRKDGDAKFSDTSDGFMEYIARSCLLDIDFYTEATERCVMCEVSLRRGNHLTYPVSGWWIGGSPT